MHAKKTFLSQCLFDIVFLAFWDTKSIGKNMKIIWKEVYSLENYYDIKTSNLSTIFFQLSKSLDENAILFIDLLQFFAFWSKNETELGFGPKRVLVSRFYSSVGSLIFIFWNGLIYINFEKNNASMKCLQYIITVSGSKW